MHLSVFDAPDEEIEKLAASRATDLVASCAVWVAWCVSDTSEGDDGEDKCDGSGHE